jgi:broad specificity phosphatase PhoE
LRHGDTGQTGFRGQLDDSLSALGWQQLRAVCAEHAGSAAWTTVLSSPQRRCAEFAHALSRERDLPLVFDAGLAEYAFGDWTGATSAELFSSDPDALERFWRDPVAHPPPGAETILAFSARVQAALNSAHAREPQARPLVLTHGGVIRMLRCLQEGIPLQAMSSVEVAHASMHRLQWPLPEAMPI